MPAIIQPVLHYADQEEALAFLCKAFGFKEHAIHRTPSGEVAYIEAEFDGCVTGIGKSQPGNLFDLGPTAVYIACDEVDAIHARAKDAGVEIVMEPTDQDYGSRDFIARDYEGNLWCFGTYRPGG